MICLAWLWRMCIQLFQTKRVYLDYFCCHYTICGVATYIDTKYWKPHISYIALIRRKFTARQTRLMALHHPDKSLYTVDFVCRSRKTSLFLISQAVYTRDYTALCPSYNLIHIMNGWREGRNINSNASIVYSINLPLWEILPSYSLNLLVWHMSMT